MIIFLVNLQIMFELNFLMPATIIAAVLSFLAYIAVFFIFYFCVSYLWLVRYTPDFISLYGVYPCFERYWMSITLTLLVLFAFSSLPGILGLSFRRFKQKVEAEVEGDEQARFSAMIARPPANAAEALAARKRELNVVRKRERDGAGGRNKRTVGGAAFTRTSAPGEHQHGLKQAQTCHELQHGVGNDTTETLGDLEAGADDSKLSSTDGGRRRPSQSRWSSATLVRQKLNNAGASASHQSQSDDTTTEVSEHVSASATAPAAASGDYGATLTASASAPTGESRLSSSSSSSSMSPSSANAKIKLA